MGVEKTGRVGLFMGMQRAAGFPLHPGGALIRGQDVKIEGLIEKQADPVCGQTEKRQRSAAATEQKKSFFTGSFITMFSLSVSFLLFDLQIFYFCISLYYSKNL